RNSAAEPAVDGRAQALRAGADVPDAAGPRRVGHLGGHRVVDVDVLAGHVPGFEHPGGARVGGRRHLRLVDQQAVDVVVARRGVLDAVAVRNEHRAAAPPEARGGQDLVARGHALGVVGVANGVGVGAAAAERVAVVVVAVQAAAVGGQVGVLHARAADLLDAAVGVGPVHVPDQVWMLVVVVRGRIAGEL